MADQEQRDEQERKDVRRVADESDVGTVTDMAEYDTAGTGIEEQRGHGPPRRRAGLMPDERDPDAPAGPPGSAGGGVNMSGTPAGGTSIGGMGGENQGDGAFDNAESVADAFGDGTYDDLGNEPAEPNAVDLVGDEEEDNPNSGLESNPADGPYAGPSGGAVGGTPAQGRAEGGHLRHGFSPGPPSKRGDTSVGSDPDNKADDRSA